MCQHFPDHPDPFESESPDGGVMVFGFGALAGVVSTGPSERGEGRAAHGEGDAREVTVHRVGSKLSGLKDIGRASIKTMRVYRKGWFRCRGAAELAVTR